MYHYSRMKDAEHEVRSADGDYYRQQQYFEANPKLREQLELRKSKTERNFSTARTDYTKAAREAEPLLRRLNTENIPPRESAPSRVDEESVRKVVQQEMRITERTFVRFRDLETELDMVRGKLARELVKQDDLKVMLKKYALWHEHEKLVEQVRELSLRGRQRSVSSDNSRDLDQRLVQNREFDQVRAEFKTKTDQLGTEVAMLKGLFNNMHKDSDVQPGRRTKQDGNAKPEELAKVRLTEDICL